MKVLAICDRGSRRSKYLAEYLKKKGYSTKYGGISDKAITKITKSKIDWADKLIFVDKYVKNKFVKKYKLPKKDIINLNVTENLGDYPKEAKEILNKAMKKFKEKYVIPNLRGQIDKKIKEELI